MRHSILIALFAYLQGISCTNKRPEPFQSGDRRGEMRSEHFSSWEQKRPAKNQRKLLL